jgi:hypothetical protein
MKGRHFEKCSTHHPRWVSWGKIKIKIMNNSMGMY